MESILPRPEDHCRIQILIKPLGRFPPPTFTRLVRTLEQRLGSVEVAASANARRRILPKLVTELNSVTELSRFGEFQAFRKVFGLIGVGQFSSNHLSTSASSPDLNSPPNSSRNDSPTDEEQDSPSPSRMRRSSLARFPSTFSAGPELSDNSEEQQQTSTEFKQLKLLKEQYADTKQSLKDQLVDSRCALFGFGCDITNSAECQSFPGSDDLSAVCDHLEGMIHELIRSIYFVLESRRLDTSFERMDNPPCPSLPDEDKYRMGLENVKSKAYRKKCIGRLRKKVGDYAFLTGLFEAAIHSYQSSIDLLKSTTDLLWLAAAYEGWCCAAMMIKYRHRLAQKEESGQLHSGEQPNKTMPRVHTAVNSLMNSSEDHQLKSSIGHQRYCSDEAAKLLAVRATSTILNAEVAISAAEAESAPTSNGASPQFVRRTSAEDEEKGEERGNESGINLDASSNKSSSSSFFGGKGNGTKRRPWRQLLNFDSSSSYSAPKVAVQYEQLPMPSALSSASRCSSAQNLAISTSSPSSASHQQLPPAMNGPSSKIAQNFSRNELMERFRAALENYGRFSFAVHVEYECVMRAVHLLIFHHQYIEVETFLREHTCRFLDDKFLTFNNTMKSNICLAAAEVYGQIGFRRKLAFFLRLAVFFRLYMESHSEQDYRRVYPILNQSLIGYGIGGKSSLEGKFVPHKCRPPSSARSFSSSLSSHSNGLAPTFSLQVKAVHEVCTVAVRAGLREMAIRHLCFMLESFFDQLDRAALFSLVEELHKLTQMHGANKEPLHALHKPLTLDSTPPVILAPLQLTQIPSLSHFNLLPLPAHLAPRILQTSALNSKIFIYSPFQDRVKKDETHWVVNCASQVSVRVQNPLPIDLQVNNFALITEGCQFDAIPIRLNLPSCYGSCITDPSQNEVKLLGVPRSIGTLKITGYVCEVLGCRNVCKFPSKSNSSGSHHPPLNRHFAVRVLPSLPLLRIETSLKRSPTLSDNPNEAIAEVCVFTGQSYIHTLTLYNSSDSVDIKHITIKIQQPQTCGGPNLFQIVAENDTICQPNTSGAVSDFRLSGLKAGERRNMDIRIFGIDPTTATLSDQETARGANTREPSSSTQPQIGQEQRVFVRRPTSAANGAATIVTAATTTGGLTATNADRISSHSDASGNSSGSSASSKSSQKRQSSSSSEAMPLLEQQQENSPIGAENEATAATKQHDLIPYIGRLLAAEFSFSYTADLASSPTGEEYMRLAKLPLAVTIVPAVNVSGWHILAGDSPFTRYVVIDVANQTDREAELAYGAASSSPERTEADRTIIVQPRETCRVPLLCPCCRDIQSSAFQRAAQQASHMMQMQVIDRLRRKLERHLTKHLEIRWRINKLKLEGQVPIGSLLSSVSFLRQLVLPSVTIGMKANGAKRKDSTSSSGDVPIQLGVFEPVRVFMYCSELRECLTGEMSLTCYQQVQSDQFMAVDRVENMLICGADRVPFCVEPSSSSSNRTRPAEEGEMGEEEEGAETKSEKQKTHFEAEFMVAFCFEGIHRVRPVLRFDPASSLDDQDIFLPSLSFNVISK